MKSFQLVTLVALWSFSCGVGTGSIDDWGDEVVDSVEGPLLGNGRQDSSDTGCNIVLRSTARVQNGPGFQTKCVNGVCSVVWVGVLDISKQAAAEGAKPYVLFKNQDAQSWSQVLAKLSTGAPEGFVRYSFRLEKNTLSDGLSATALNRAKLELAPFLRTKAGGRVFDKQRGQGAFENYALTASNGFSVIDDARVCAPPAAPARIEFLGSFTHQQTRALVSGSSAVITYAIDRLSTCRGTHNGAPAWNIEAFVRFSPGGELVSGSVRGFNSPNGGAPTNASAVAVPFSFKIPPGATRAELWFRNSTGAGSNCEAWDSNNGSNYAFTVESQPFAAVQWVGRPGSSTSRACARSEGAPETMTLDSYAQQRACVWFEADVYVPGLTDGVGGLKPFAIRAEAELLLDGVALPPQPLQFLERNGNDYRYRFELPKSTLFYGPKWKVLQHTMRFSTDGRTWQRDVTRTVLRDPSFCNAAWGDCAL